MNLLKKFSGTKLKLALLVLTYKNKFPGVTAEFLKGFRDWIAVDDNFQWLLDRRTKWEKNQPLEELKDDIFDLKEDLK